MPWSRIQNITAGREFLSRTLASVEPDTATLEADIFLEHVVGCDRTFLLTHGETLLTSEQKTTLAAFLDRRLKHEPVAYIIGEWDFYGRTFYVDPNVLVPRPETEHLVDFGITRVRAAPKRSVKVLEMGLGSGCVSITLLLECAWLCVDSSEISDQALGVARKNAQKHGVLERMRIFKGDLFEALEANSKYDLIIMNPPYVEESYKEQMQKDVLHFEPHQALFSGEDGLDLIRRLIEQAPTWLNQDGVLAFEFGFGQRKALEELGHERGHELHFIRDLQHHDRICWMTFA
ncbi:MAG: peptide chain release factor N(5)-glutamine methyltransferase [Myxococcota bacterium]|nr:peptide chain release factor N(5)-glutamine methyltransferase [Myxococcota bacterium]